MIIAWAPNPALDVTYTLPALHVGEVHRVDDVDRRAGGKAANVAGVLASMSHRPVTLQALGGPEVGVYLADLAARGITGWTVPSPVPSRQCVTVVAGGDATALNEAGQPQPESVWSELAALLAARAGGHGVFAACGSLPPRTRGSVVADMIGVAHAAGLRAVLDCRGQALTAALAHRPALVKPNRAEAAETTGQDDPSDAASALIDRGARVALISDGGRGLILVTEFGVRLRARPGRLVSGNPTGAGDALTAAICAALDGVDGLPTDADWWAGALAAGIGWSAAAVMQPTGGAIDPADAARLTDAAVIEPLG